MRALCLNERSGSYTIIDNILNDHFWNPAVEYLPIWMAPNLVTMLGTCIMMFTTMVQLAFSPHFSEAAPIWVRACACVAVTQPHSFCVQLTHNSYINVACMVPLQVYWLSALGLFMYQTLDALDGKQARRTSSSSPLGQLFDHGCDALSTVFNVLSAAATVQVGPGFRAFLVLSSVSTTFYLAQWEEYHTGVMSCGNGWYGVTEGQLSLVMIHIMTAIIGPGLWTIKLPFLPFTTADALVLLLVASNVVLAFSNVTNVLNAPADAIPRSELGNKHVSKPLAVSQLIPIAILLVLGSLWVAGPNADDYAAYPVVFLFAIGIGYVLFSVRYYHSVCCSSWHGLSTDLAHSLCTHLC